MDEHRILRVSETVREELAEIIGFEMSDPRLAAVDVTEVHLSPDSRHAHIGVSLSGDKREQEQAMAALEHAKNFLRHELARRLNLRRKISLKWRWGRNGVGGGPLVCGRRPRRPGANLHMFATAGPGGSAPLEADTKLVQDPSTKCKCC